MNRRHFVKRVFLASLPFVTGVEILPSCLAAAPLETAPSFLGTAQGKDWLTRWEANILGDARNRYCDKEMGEELGWLVSPFLNGFYYGYLATRNPKWVELLIDWTEACIRRSVQEPDGYIGWPKSEVGGGFIVGLFLRQFAR